MTAMPPDRDGCRPELEFWFEFASTYSYLAAARLADLATKAGITVVWRPFLLGPIFAAQGWSTSPFDIYPAKGRYMWRDMTRLCEAHALPFARPATFPQNGLHAARTALAALQTDPDAGAQFCREIFRAQFARGALISDPDTILGALRRAGLSGTLLDAGDDPKIKHDLRVQTDRAQSLGIFGAPSFTVGTELFWGNDRLEQAVAYASRQPGTAGVQA